MVKMESLNTTRLQASRNVEKQNVHRTPVPIKNYKSARIHHRGSKTEKRKLNQDLRTSPTKEEVSAEPWSPLQKNAVERDSELAENDHIASIKGSNKQRRENKQPDEEMVAKSQDDRDLRSEKGGAPVLND